MSKKLMHLAYLAIGLVGAIAIVLSVMAAESANRAILLGR